MALQVPAETRRADAEMAIAVLREELNRALSYKTRYDTEGHNICLAIVELTTGGTAVLGAYSNDSAIPQSIRLHLNLVPDTYALLPQAQRFGCDGMAQLHTEPKLLNFLTAAPAIRAQPFSSAPPPKPPRGPQLAFYRAVVGGQRSQATAQARLLPAVQAVKSVTLVSEIDCCRTCCDYSIDRFRARFPGKPLEIIELGKVSGQATPYSRVTITRTP